MYPKLRFPQFKNCKGWEVVELSYLGKLISGLTYKPENIRDSGLLVLRSSNIQNQQIDLTDSIYVDEHMKANLSEPNDILICVRNGSTSLIGKNALITSGIPKSTHGAFMSVFRTPKYKFVFQLFQTEIYQQYISNDLGATINSINSKNFLKYLFPVPSDEKEQQAIADCLSSLDNLISEENEYIGSLKAHKKGLMQQLFPQSIN